MTLIRKGVKEDLPIVFELIKELADYENGLDQVSTTVESMERNGFGSEALYEFYIAEHENIILGIALYYYRYSTWKGKQLYLEDLIVTKKAQGTGVGKMLFDQMIAQGKTTNCTGMMWQVLDWNQLAIDFYKRNNATFDKGWINGSLNW